jgi:hypothetical protein
MEIKALIVEQLDWDGTLKTMRLQPDYSRPLIVAFPDEYAERREGPVQFLDSTDEDRFSKGFADCKMRRLSSSRFRRDNGLASVVVRSRCPVPSATGKASHRGHGGGLRVGG